jgi:hypothetical protein
MKGKPSLLFTVALVSSSFGGPTLAHAEEVNMSRLRATAVMPAQGTPGVILVYQAVDPTVMDAFCGDGDGCTIRLQMLTADAVPKLRGGQRILFKSGVHWTTNVDTTDYVDGDNNDEPKILATSLGISGDFCQFSDVNDDGFDDAAGFSVVAFYSTGTGTPGFTCLLTLTD